MIYARKQCMVETNSSRSGPLFSWLCRWGRKFHSEFTTASGSCTGMASRLDFQCRSKGELHSFTIQEISWLWQFTRKKRWRVLLCVCQSSSDSRESHSFFPAFRISFAKKKEKFFHLLGNRTKIFFMGPWRRGSTGGNLRGGRRVLFGGGQKFAFLPATG